MIIELINIHTTLMRNFNKYILSRNSKMVFSNMIQSDFLYINNSPFLVKIFGMLIQIYPSFFPWDAIYYFPLWVPLWWYQCILIIFCHIPISSGIKTSQGRPKYKDSWIKKVERDENYCVVKIIPAGILCINWLFLNI